MSRIITGTPHIRRYGEPMEAQVPMRMGLYGEYRIIKRNSMGQINLDTGWRPNIITDRGIRYMTIAYSNQMNYFIIGTGTTPPATTDTSIETFLQWGTGTAPGGSIFANQGAPNYIGTHIASKRFDAGVAGTVTEFALCNSSSGTGAGIRCAVSPAINKASDEVLDVYHKLYQYPRAVGVDQYIEVSLDGDDYGVTSRWNRLEELPANHGGLGSNPSPYTCVAYYTQTLPAIATEDPSTAGGSDATSGGSLTITDNSGASGLDPDTTGFTEWKRVFGLDEANFGTLPTGGIGLVRERFNSASEGSYVSRFARLSDGARVQKDNTKVFWLWWRMEWQRYDLSTLPLDRGTFNITGVDIDTSVA